MSPTVASLPVPPKNPKGKKVAGKPGRFDPDRPLQMTTRRRGKQSLSGSAPSVNGSVEENASRRPSLDGERPVTAHSNGSKGTYVSDYSPPQPVPDVVMDEAPSMPSFAEAVNGARMSRSPARGQQTSLPNLKRKRDSPSPESNTPYVPAGPVNAPEDGTRRVEDEENDDSVEVVPEDQLSDREESGDELTQVKDGSHGNLQSQGLALPYDANAGTSVDVTPMLSEQPSPVTSGTSTEDNQEANTPIAKPLVEALNSVANAVADVATEEQEPQDVTMLDVAQVIEDAEEIEDQVRTDEEGRMVIRKGKFGGRRRAQHPNAKIEAAMRRQAQLKSAYRTMARAQKNMALEITQRTIDDLEANPTHHTEVAEYDHVIQELSDALAKRKAAIRMQHEMKMKQLKTTLDSERDSTFAKCRRQLEDIEEAKIDQLQYESLRIARKAQLDDGNETEDEDEVIPRLKRSAYNFKRGPGLDPVYDSRSRLTIETRRATGDMEARYKMFQALQRLADEDKPTHRNAFVMDQRPRTAAATKRDGETNMGVLADAVAETERIASIPIIPNEQAVGLKMLSDLASRPSIASMTNGQPPTNGSMSSQGGGGSKQVQVEVPGEPGRSIEFTMSPRTQHAMAGRFDANQMPPPPQTPRQEAPIMLDRLSDGKRHERQPSTPGQIDRPSISQASPRNGPAQSPGMRRPSNEVNNLHHRNASRDHMLLESIFGSGSPRGFPGPPAPQPTDFPGGPRRRAVSHSDPAPPFGFHSDPTPITQPEPKRQKLDNQTTKSERAPGATLKFDPVRSETPRWKEQQPSQAGASNGPICETTSAQNGKEAIAGAGPSQEPVPTASQDNAAPTTGTQPQDEKKPAKARNYHKTNKKERDGLSRSEAKKRKKQEKARPASAAGTPNVGGPPAHMDSPATGIPSPVPWHSRSVVFPPEFAPPSGPFRHSDAYASPMGFPPRHHLHPDQRRSFDLNHLLHRDSFGPGPAYGPPPPHPPHPPPQHHPNNFFGPPPPAPHQHQQQHQPPPPGVAPDQYAQRLPLGPPGAPPNHFQFPPPPPPGLPRGPAIAPAPPGAGFPPPQQQGNFRPASGSHPPAFAQQQQQQGGGGGGGGRREGRDAGGRDGNRRRTQSDVGFAKFQPPWRPKK